MFAPLHKTQREHTASASATWTSTQKLHSGSFLEYRSIEYSATPALAQLLLHPAPWKLQDAEATGRVAFFAVMPLLFGRIEFE
jgi:hypothetical protein